MTANQVAYWRNVEQERTNRVRELEENRSNRARERENTLTNYRNWMETNRANIAKENLAKEEQALVKRGQNIKAVTDTIGSVTNMVGRIVSPISGNLTRTPRTSNSSAFDRALAKSPYYYN